MMRQVIIVLIKYVFTVHRMACMHTQVQHFVLKRFIPIILI